MRSKPISKTCQHCGVKFSTLYPKTRFCSLKCAGQFSFWSRIEKTDSCWNWTGTLDRDGYGATTIRSNGVRGNQRVHRVVYEQLVGPIPDGMTIDHLCRNRRCVNPDHLEPVTNTENLMRGEVPWKSLQVATHCQHGHEFTPENTKFRNQNGKRTRQCRACVNFWKRGQKWGGHKPLIQPVPHTPGTGECDRPAA